MTKSPESPKQRSLAPSSIADLSRRIRRIRINPEPRWRSRSRVPRTVAAIVRHVISQRHALVRALTIEAEELFSKCAIFRARGEQIWLFGHDREWEVQVESQLNHDLPIPVSLETIPETLTKSWLVKVAMASDSWLVDVALHHGSGLNRDQRRSLFDMMFAHASVEDSVRQWTSCAKNMTNTSESNSAEGQFDVWCENLEGEKDICSFCWEKHCELVKIGNDLWIPCHYCPKRFHQACVGVTSELAKLIDRYICSDCIEEKKALKTEGTLRRIKHTINM